MSINDEIARLQQLHQSGALTDEEFQQAKARMLRYSDGGDIPPASSAAPQQAQAGVGAGTGAAAAMPPNTQQHAQHAPYGTPPNTTTQLSPSTQDQQTRQWAMFLHLSVFAGILVPLAGLIAPIVIWQLKKQELPGIDPHGKHVTNWLISYTVYVVVSFLLSFVLIGIPLLIVLGLACIVMPIIGAIKANNGELWKYPLTFELLK